MKPLKKRKPENKINFFLKVIKELTLLNRSLFFHVCLMAVICLYTLVIDDQDLIEKYGYVLFYGVVFGFIGDSLNENKKTKVSYGMFGLCVITTILILSETMPNIFFEIETMTYFGVFVVGFYILYPYYKNKTNFLKGSLRLVYRIFLSSMISQLILGIIAAFLFPLIALLLPSLEEATLKGIIFISFFIVFYTYTYIKETLKNTKKEKKVAEQKIYKFFHIILNSAYILGYLFIVLNIISFIGKGGYPVNVVGRYSTVLLFSILVKVFITQRNKLQDKLYLGGIPLIFYLVRTTYIRVINYGLTDARLFVILLILLYILSYIFYLLYITRKIEEFRDKVYIFGLLVIVSFVFIDSTSDYKKWIEPRIKNDIQILEEGNSYTLNYYNLGGDNLLYSKGNEVIIYSKDGGVVKVKGEKVSTFYLGYRSGEINLENGSIRKNYSEVFYKSKDEKVEEVNIRNLLEKDIKGFWIDGKIYSVEELKEDLISGNRKRGKNEFAIINLGDYTIIGTEVGVSIKKEKGKKEEIEFTLESYSNFILIDGEYSIEYVGTKEK